MKPISQLLRQPIRTIAVLILLTVSASFMCLGWGVLRSSQATAEEIDNSFVTLALLSPDVETGTDYNYDEETGKQELYLAFVERIAISNGVRVETFGRVSDVTDLIIESPHIRGSYNQQFASAYIPSLRTVTSSTSGNNYYSTKDVPYSRTVLTFTVTDFVEQDNSHTFSYLDSDGNLITVDKYDFNLYGDIIEYVSLHPDYEPRGKVELYCSFDSKEMFDETVGEIEIGKTYIVYMDDYSDGDLWLRDFLIMGTLENWGYTTSDINWDNLTYDLKDYPADLQYSISPDGTKEIIPTVAMYVDPETGLGIAMSQERLDIIDRCSANVSSSNGLTFAEIDGSLEDFLADPANAEWVQLLDLINKQYSTAPIVGTDLLESMYLFHQNAAFVSEGRTFERSDYDEGKNVCIISETVAYESGLSVGDKIELSFYKGGQWYSSIMPGYEYYARKLYKFTEFEDTREYEIVGVYRNTIQWTDMEYNFTPDMIFVPNKSLEGIATETDERQLLSLVIKNGHTDDVKTLLEENGWDRDIMVYFDSGYGVIEDTVAGLQESATQLFGASAATFLAILIAYIALFVVRQRRNAGLMLSLGSGRHRAARFILVTSMIPAVISSFIGALTGALLLNRTVQSVFNDASEAFNTAFSSTAASGYANTAAQVTVLPSSAIAAGAVLIVIYFVIIAAVSHELAGRKPLDLIKK